MKLCYILNKRIPTEKAYGYTVSKMCEQLAAAGTEVRLILPRSLNKNPQALFGFYNISRTFSIETRWCWGGNEQTPGGLFAKLLRAVSFGLSLLFLPLPKDAIVYLRDIYLLPFVRWKGRRVFVESHYLQQKEKRLGFLYRFTHGVVVTTKHLKDRVSEFGVAAERILVAPDAVDLEVFDIELSKQEARGQINLPSAKSVVGYTGNFSTMGMDKGLTDILAAVAVLKKSGKELLFVGVGGSRQDCARYTQMAAALRVTDFAVFRERVALSKLAIYQKACDALLMPFPDNEHYRYYMSPLKMFEYMAAKRPIVASDLPSIREILSESNAVLVKPDDPLSLAEGIEEVLTHPELTHELSSQAFADVQNYTWQKRAGRILDWIRR